MPMPAPASRAWPTPKRWARPPRAALGVDADEVLVCSTGIIGTPLPMDLILEGDAEAGEEAFGGRRRGRGARHPHHRQGRQAGGRPRLDLHARRHGQGLRDDRAQHGDDARLPHHRRRRCRATSCRRSCATPPTAPSTRSTSTARPRPTTPRSCSPAAGAARPTRPNSPTRSHALCEDLTYQMAQRRRGHDQDGDAAGHRRRQRRRGADRRQEHRREQSRQMLLVWQRSLLGPAARRRRIGRDRLRSGEDPASLMAASSSRAPAPMSTMTPRRSRAHMRNERIEIEVALGPRQGPGAGDRHRSRPRLYQGKFEDLMSSSPAAHRARPRRGPALYPAASRGKAVVVKLGGAAIDKELDRALAQDVLLLRSVGVRCVLVHGGGPQVDAMMKRMGKKPEFRDGLRVTDEETLRDRAHGAGRQGQSRPRRHDQPRDARRSGRGRRLRRGWRPAHHARRAIPLWASSATSPGARRAAPRPARRGPGAGRLDDRRRSIRPALQYQRRRGGDGDRGGDGRGEDRLPDRRARPARGRRRRNLAWSSA